jgi:hypothetical protein
VIFLAQFEGEIASSENALLAMTGSIGRLAPTQKGQHGHRLKHVGLRASAQPTKAQRTNIQRCLVVQKMAIVSGIVIMKVNIKQRLLTSISKEK